MKIGLIGRTSLLLETGKLLHEAGFNIGFVVTSKEAPEYDVTSNDFKEFAKERGCSFLHNPAITKEELEELIIDQDIPLVISINYSGVISKEVTDLFPLGILNAHGGDLPRYRGNACQAWAIINGEKEIGLCIHRMVGGELDSGDILDRKYYPVDIDTRVGEVYQWFEKDIPQMFLKVVDKLKVQPEFVMESQSKNPSMALRCYPRKPEDGKIDWNQDAEKVLRLINASSEPFAGAFSEYEGDKLIIWRAKLIHDDEVFCAVNGQVLKIGQGFIDVSCNNTKLRLLEIEYQGNRQSPENLINSIRKRLS